jgi:hypothetical protein
MIHHIKPSNLPGLQSPIENIGREIEMNIRMDLGVWHLRHTIERTTREANYGWAQ